LFPYTTLFRSHHQGFQPSCYHHRYCLKTYTQTVQTHSQIKLPTIIESQNSSFIPKIPRATPKLPLAAGVPSQCGLFTKNALTRQSHKRCRSNAVVRVDILSTQKLNCLKYHHAIFCI